MGASPEAEEVAGPWCNAGNDFLAVGTEDVAGDPLEKELGAQQGSPCMAQTKKTEKNVTRSAKAESTGSWRAPCEDREDPRKDPLGPKEAIAPHRPCVKPVGGVAGG